MRKPNFASSLNLLPTMVETSADGHLQANIQYSSSRFNSVCYLGPVWEHKVFVIVTMIGICNLNIITEPNKIWQRPQSPTRVPNPRPILPV